MAKSCNSHAFRLHTHARCLPCWSRHHASHTTPWCLSPSTLQPRLCNSHTCVSAHHFVTIGSGILLAGLTGSCQVNPNSREPKCASAFEASLAHCPAAAAVSCTTGHALLRISHTIQATGCTPRTSLIWHSHAGLYTNQLCSALPKYVLLQTKPLLLRLMCKLCSCSHLRCTCASAIEASPPPALPC
jgi:hypothetical protein